jgi:hypothetical protein
VPVRGPKRKRRVKRSKWFFERSFLLNVRLGNSILEAQAISIPEGSPLIESSY